MSRPVYFGLPWEYAWWMMKRGWNTWRREGEEGQLLLAACHDGWDDGIWDKSIGKVSVGIAAIFEMYSEANFAHWTPSLFVTFLLKLRQTIFFLRSHQKKNSFYLLLRDWRWKEEAKNTPSLFIIYYRIVSKGENCASRQGNRKNWTKEGKKKLKLSILEMPFTVATSMPHFDKRSSNILAAATRKENFNLCSRRVWSAVEKRVPKKPRSWIYILPVVDAHVSEWNHVEITASTLLHRIRARVTLQSVPGAPLEGQ